MSEGCTLAQAAASVPLTVAADSHPPGQSDVDERGGGRVRRATPGPLPLYRQRRPPSQGDPSTVNRSARAEESPIFSDCIETHRHQARIKRSTGTSISRQFLLSTALNNYANVRQASLAVLTRVSPVTSTCLARYFFGMRSSKRDSMCALAGPGGTAEQHAGPEATSPTSSDARVLPGRYTHAPSTQAQAPESTAKIPYAL
eukprot:2738666-Pyramimonas_sp.AAC.2